jgi:hypothetical protein
MSLAGLPRALTVSTYLPLRAHTMVASPASDASAGGGGGGEATTGGGLHGDGDPWADDDGSEAGGGTAAGRVRPGAVDDEDKDGEREPVSLTAWAADPRENPNQAMAWDFDRQVGGSSLGGHGSWQRCSVSDLDLRVWMLALNCLCWKPQGLHSICTLETLQPQTL